jgi:mannose/cellobiose epimerase-like protein (N-acyl-D-glucosamine 2-epimerase family)
LIPPPQSLRELSSRLKVWLNEAAFPLWWEKGADHVFGGFHEKLDLHATPVILPKRARVQPRQIYAYSLASSLGWSGDSTAVVRFGIDFYLPHYRRPDGLFRTLVAPDGKTMDDGVAFYDQAFALLGLHAAYRYLGAPFLQDHARHLMRQWSATYRHPNIGFEESVPRRLPLCANPHMHLFESCLAWNESDPAGPWRATAAEIARLALDKLIDPASGALREFFDGDWRMMPGGIIEPGHQFEWAWLLLRWGGLVSDRSAIAAALRLIEIGEVFGTDPVRNVTFNSLHDDLSPHDRKARLWPQTERLKAHCLAAELTGEAAHWDKAVRAAEGLLAYLDLPIAGLWRDVMTERGDFIEEPAPASSFYHIVCAIAELDRVVDLKV